MGGSVNDWQPEPAIDVCKSGVLRLSPTVLAALAIVVIGQVAQTRTVFARPLIAIGTNADRVIVPAVLPDELWQHSG
jgi:ribose/xylose/arabinose/galactoside ABC-type transport system permease subunit